jgi:flagellar hook assembly protein FlgD
VILYNSAGEVVRSLYDGFTHTQAVGIRSETLSVMVEGRLPVAIHIDGITLDGAAQPIVWLGDNDNGQTVSNGTYYLKVETLDPFGTVTTLSHAVSVLGNHNGNSLAIFNSAGELVRKIPLDGLPAGLVDFDSRLVDGNGGADGVKFDLLDGDGVLHAWEWDGLNEQGQPVASGSYVVRLLRTDLGVGVTVKSIGIVLLQAPNDALRSLLDSAVVGPNPWGPGHSQGAAQLRYSPQAGRQAVARAYNLAGELVSSGIDPQGSGRLSLPMDGLASGIYLIVFEAVDGPARLGRRTLKLAVVR